jgi:folate-binding protein YgfZ
MFSRDHYDALKRGAGILDRSRRGRLALTGADRRAYLQGILSNDIVALTAGSGCYATFLTPQGRMIADLRVFETGDRLIVDLEERVAAEVAARFEQFIFSEDVTVEDLGASTSQIGVYGPRAAALLETEPLAEYAVRSWTFGGQQAYLLGTGDIGVPGIDVIVPRDQAAELERFLVSRGAIVIDDETAEVTRVEAGRPRFTVDMDTDTIPLEAGIEDRAISFTKGCYVGQEIIIRVMHRGGGRVARRLVGIEFEPDAAVPTHGDVVKAGERQVGYITSAVRSVERARPIALAYVHRDFAKEGEAVSAAGVNATGATLTGKIYRSASADEAP